MVLVEAFIEFITSGAEGSIYLGMSSAELWRVVSIFISATGLKPSETNKHQLPQSSVGVLMEWILTRIAAYSP